VTWLLPAYGTRDTQRRRQPLFSFLSLMVAQVSVVIRLHSVQLLLAQVKDPQERTRSEWTSIRLYIISTYIFLPT
jgi:hypothetical protein